MQSCGKKRFILDLRFVYKYFFKQRFKVEDWRVGLDYFDKGCFFPKFYLLSGYHHLDISRISPTLFLARLCLGHHDFFYFYRFALWFILGSINFSSSSLGR